METSALICSTSFRRTFQATVRVWPGSSQPASISLLRKDGSTTSTFPASSNSSGNSILAVSGLTILTNLACFRAVGDVRC